MHFPRSHRWLAAAVLACALVLPRRATAQRRDTILTASVPASSSVSPASPRAAMRTFFDLTRAGRAADAAPYLDLPDSLRAQGPALARELEVVLDRHVFIDLDDISGDAAGDTTDDLPRAYEQIATIRGPRGEAQPVRLVRVRDADVSWRFSRATVGRIGAWYRALPDRWLREHLPPALLRVGPLELLWWQWLALPLLVAVSWLVGTILSRIARAVLERVVTRTATGWDDAILKRVGGPLALALTLTVASALIPWLALYAGAQNSLYRVVKAGFFIVFFWALWRSVDVVRQIALQSEWALRAAPSRSLVPLGARLAKIGVMAIAAVAVLSVLGYPVASLIAGLGLGGLAVALAAQKTVENLFGAFSIGVDQPFREGDFVKAEEITGTVETIGLRSTRFRTLDRTLITIPNGKLAEMRIESFAVRDRLRFSAVIGLVYETTAQQMRDVLAGFERVLRAQPKLWPDAVTVKFSQLGASSLDVEVMAWFATTDWSEFQRIRQEVLLAFMEVVERAGTSIAFPSRTVYLANAGAPSQAPAGDGVRTPPASPDSRSAG